MEMEAYSLISSKNHMNLTTDKPIKRFIFNGDSIYVVFSFGDNGMMEHEIVPMNPESLKWVSEVCKVTGVGVSPNYNRISPEHMNLWRELIGKPPINHVLA